MINVSVLDKQGREIPDAMNMIQFKLNGNATILGVGNGDPSSHEADKCLDGNWKRSLFNGKCQIILESMDKEGDFSLTATADGLQNATATIQMKK